MIFTTGPFAVFFVAIFVLLLVIRNDVARRWILLTASIFFYGFWNTWCVLLMAAVILWSWLLGLFIASADDKRKKKLGVAIGTTLSLAALAVFKYAGFLSRNLVLLSGGEVPAFIKDIVLPVGISFYTFHSISYYVDVYRGRVAAARSLRDYSLYIAFFPQLVAGPIVRASQFLPQLDRPVKLTLEGLAAGARLFLAGALQKLLLADQVSPFVDAVFAQPTLYSGGTEWLAVIAYAVQIFGDFSGYTLMAIGVARVLGYELPENFRMPYISSSISEFWQRWHITLSLFLRDYLYISLGGNRRGFCRTQFNTAVTMLLGGLWHGASWNFVLWGGLHGIAIIIDHSWKRLFPVQVRDAVYWKMVERPLGWALTLLFVLMAWIPFRAVRFSDTSEIIGRIWALADGVVWYHTPTVVVILGVVTWHVVAVMQLRSRLVEIVLPRWLYTFEVTAMLSLLILFAPLTTSPFIYFQF